MSSRIDILNAAKIAADTLDQYRSKSRIQEGYTRIDPAVIASNANIPLVYRPLEKLLGSFIRFENTVGILVNNDRPRGLVHMTCAHELGHYFLGHDSNSDITVEYGYQAEKLEVCANHFAYSLLSPKWLISSTMKQKGWFGNDLTNPIIVYQLSLRLGISYTAIIWSLFHMSLLKDPHKDYLLKFSPKSIKQMIACDNKLQIGNNDVWLLNERDRDHILEPAIGDRYIFDLPNHAGSGHLWEIDAAKSEGFNISPFVVNRENHKSVDQPIIIGGKKTLKYMLDIPAHLKIPIDASDTELSIEKNRREISLFESKIWSADDTISEFSFFTELELIKNGLSVQEQEKLKASFKNHL